MTESTLPPATRIGRVSMQVADLDGLADFYERVVGLTVQEYSDDRAILGAGEQPLVQLVHAHNSQERPQTAAGLFHTAVRVPSREALGAALARVERHSQLTGASDHHVSEALYLRDPEGNGVEIYRDRPRDAWPTQDGRVSMDTLPLDLAELREFEDGHADTVPDGTQLGHVHLEVTSLPSARAFYVDRLGLGIRQEWGDEALFVAAGDYHHHVGLNTWNGRSMPAQGRGIEWFELVVPDRSALASARDRLSSGAVDVTDSDDGLAVEDPDGIGVRLHSA